MTKLLDQPNLGIAFSDLGCLNLEGTYLPLWVTLTGMVGFINLIYFKGYFIDVTESLYCKYYAQGIVVF